MASFIQKPVCQGWVVLPLCEPFVTDIQKKRCAVKNATLTRAFDGYAHSINNEISACTARIRVMLISSERFSVVREKGLSDLATELSSFRVSPILYLRRQDHLAESLHAQAFRIDSSYFRRERLLNVEKRTFRFMDLASSWAETFGRENMIVHRYIPYAVTFDFLGALRISNFDTLPAEQHLNTALSREALEYIRCHSQYRYGTPQYSSAIRGLIKYSRLHPTAPQFKRFYLLARGTYSTC